MPRLALIFACVVLAILAGCQLFQEEAETRALQFIETLVVDPANDARLREQANIAGDPRMLVDDLPVKLDLEFLRSRRAQGAAIDFIAIRVERPDDGHRKVTVTARADGSAARGSDEMVFEVTLQRDEAWRILRVGEGR